MMLFSKALKINLETLASPGMRALCPTRGTVWADSLHFIISNFNVLLTVWDKPLDYVKDSETQSRIRGISLFMRKFDFLSGTMLGECLLQHSDNLNKALQSPQVSAGDGQKMASLTVKTLEASQNDAAFGLFWERVNIKGKEVVVSKPQLPRRKQLPKRQDGGGSNICFTKTEQEYYKCIYFEALDLLVNRIRSRFDQPEYGIYTNLEKVCFSRQLEESISQVSYKQSATFMVQI